MSDAHWSRQNPSRRPEIPPLPPSHGDDYENLRINYAAVSEQLEEMFDLCRELSHHNEALEKSNLEQRDFYQRQIDQLQRERDMLQSFGARLHGKLSAINEVIQTAIQEAMNAASAATRPEVQAAPQQQIIQQAAADHPAAKPNIEEIEQAEVKRVTDAIVAINPKPEPIIGLPPPSWP